jgi:hypothetical protein
VCVFSRHSTIDSVVCFHHIFPCLLELFSSDLNYFCAFAFIQFLSPMQDKTQDTLRVFLLDYFTLVWCFDYIY